MKGSGAFAQVRKVTNRKTKAVRAMKLVEKKKLATEEEKTKFLTEIQILKSLDHPNVLKIFEFYQDKKNYYIIIELCSGGELFDKIIE
jgi:calcium-dependent protein kinase